MRDAPLLDLIEARTAAAAAWAAAEEGATRAAEHAEREDEGWNDAALAFLRLFAVRRRDATFIIEDVRDFAERSGLGKPPDARAWGAVALRAKRGGVIVRAGFGSTVRPPAHAHPCAAWRLADG